MSDESTAKQERASAPSIPWTELVETAKDITYILRPDGTYLEVNPRLCDLLRQTRNKLIGTRMTLGVEHDQISTVERVLSGIVEKRKTERSTRVFRGSNGRKHTFEVIETPLLKNGEVWAIAGIGRDITQEEILERKLWDTAEEKQSALDFALRTSLGLVKGYIYTLDQGDAMSAEQMQNYVRIVQEEVEQLSVLVDDLLDYRRAEAGKYDLSADVVDLCECIDLAVEPFRKEMERREIKFSLEKPETLDPLYVSREVVIRVLYNLIQSAISRTLHSGVISIVVQDLEDYVDITMTDDGRPIPEDELPYIFDKYSRVRKDGGIDGQRTGIGLAVSRLLVKAVGGSIRAESREKAGSVFRLMLPRRPIPVEENVETQPPASFGDVV